MNLKNLFKKSYLIGLDIGSSSVKIAQFSAKRGGFCLVKTGLKELKHSSIDPLREQEIIALLKDFFSSVNLKKSKVIGIINCPRTAIKITKEAYIPKAELHDGIRLKIKDYFPFPIDEACLDYEIVGEVVEKGIRKYEIEVAVSPRATVDKYLALLGKAGIKPVCLIPRPYAVQKLAQYFYDDDQKNATAFLTMGKSHTELSVFQGRTLAFSRKIPVTGADLTNAMTGALVSERGKTELNPEEAEKIKKEITILSEGEPVMIDGKISQAQVLAMLRTPLEQMLSEIERCFDYYREGPGGGKVELLTLFGGGAALKGIAQYLSAGLGIEVKLGDSFEGLKMDSGLNREQGAMPYRVALALGAALADTKGINLLPPEIKEGTKRAVRRGTIEAVVTAVVFLAAFFYIGMRIQLVNFQKRISVAKLELASLQPQLKKAELQGVVNKILANEPDWADILKKLPTFVPKGSYFTSISMRNDVLAIRGIIASEDAERTLSNFMLTLEQGAFNGVRLASSKQLADRPGIEFEVKCSLDQGFKKRKT